MKRRFAWIDERSDGANSNTAQAVATKGANLRPGGAGRHVTQPTSSYPDSSPWLDQKWGASVAGWPGQTGSLRADTGLMGTAPELRVVFAAKTWFAALKTHFPALRPE